MKKFIFATVAVACSLLAVSCDSESLTDPNLPAKKINVGVENIDFQQLDSIPKNNSSTMGVDDGPDDQLFPLTPPKKK